MKSKFLITLVISLALAGRASAQNVWTCKTFPDAAGLAVQFGTLAPDVQADAKVALREFQPVPKKGAAADVEPAAVIPGTPLGKMVFIDRFDALFLNPNSGTIDTSFFTSPTQVSEFLQGLPDPNASAAKIFPEQWTPIVKRQKPTRLGTIRLNPARVLWYRATQLEANGNACGNIAGIPSPTATATNTSSPNATPTETSTVGATPTATGSVGATPTATATTQPTGGPTATITATANATPTGGPEPTSTSTPCVIDLGNTNNCPEQPTATPGIGPSPTPTCVLNLGNTNNCPGVATPSSTPTSVCFIGLGGVLVCNGPTPTATATP
jgi:hypothetical protein